MASRLLLPRIADDRVPARRRAHYMAHLHDLPDRVSKPFDHVPAGASPPRVSARGGRQVADHEPPRRARDRRRGRMARAASVARRRALPRGRPAPRTVHRPARPPGAATARPGTDRVRGPGRAQAPVEASSGRRSRVDSPCRNAVAASTLPCVSTRTSPSGKPHSKRRRAESEVNRQKSPHRSMSYRTIWLIPGTVASTTPPGRRIRCSVRTAAWTSGMNGSTCVSTMQSKVSPARGRRR